MADTTFQGLSSFSRAFNQQINLADQRKTNKINRELQQAKLDALKASAGPQIVQFTKLKQAIEMQRAGMIGADKFLNMAIKDLHENELNTPSGQQILQKEIDRFKAGQAGGRQPQAQARPTTLRTNVPVPGRIARVRTGRAAPGGEIPGKSEALQQRTAQLQPPAQAEGKKAEEGMNKATFELFKIFVKTQASDAALNKRLDARIREKEKSGQFKAKETQLDIAERQRRDREARDFKARQSELDRKSREKRSKSAGKIRGKQRSVTSQAIIAGALKDLQFDAKKPGLFGIEAEFLGGESEKELETRADKKIEAIRATVTKNVNNMEGLSKKSKANLINQFLDSARQNFIGGEDLPEKFSVLVDE